MHSMRGARNGSNRIRYLLHKGTANELVLQILRVNIKSFELSFHLCKNFGPTGKRGWPSTLRQLIMKHVYVWFLAAYEQPLVSPHELHLRQTPLRTSVNAPQLPHGSPS